MSFEAYVRAKWSQLVRSFEYARDYGLDPEDIAQMALVATAGRYDQLVFPSVADLFGFTRICGVRIIARLTGQRRPTWMRVGLDFGPLPDADRFERSQHVPDVEADTILGVDFQRAFASLRRDYQRVLLMVADGYESPAIGVAMGISPEAARKLIERARKAAHDTLSGGFLSLAALRLRIRLLRRYEATPDSAAIPAGAAAASGAAALALVATVALFGAGGVQDGREGAGASSPAGRASGTAGTAEGTVMGPGRPKQPGASGVGARRLTWPLAAGGHPPASPVAVSPASFTACAPKLCLTTDPRRRPGDTLTLTALGEDAAVTQNHVPVCDVIPDNPAVDCSRQEPDAWTVKEVPPTTGGTS